MNRTIQVAFCGAAAAIQVVLLMLTNFFPNATLALPALAGVMLMAVVMEIGIRWSWAVFGICAILSFFLVSDKKAFLLYVLFLGYYPTLKACIERFVRSRVLNWILKLLVVNVAVAADLALVVWVLQLPISSYITLPFLPALLFVAANGLFVVYDFLLSGLVVQYWNRLHPHIAKLTARKR